MTTRKKKADDAPKLNLPDPVDEEGYPEGDGPAWISAALGVPGCLDEVLRHLSDDGEETSLVMRFTNGRELTIRPARLVTTRRLAETLGALGFPVPYYSPPQIAKLGQAIGRVADKTQLQEQERSYAEMASLVGAWLGDCVSADWGYLLRGRDGKHVRQAIDHVRAGDDAHDRRTPVILEPDRDALLVWTVPVTRLIRDRLGTKADGDISLALDRSGLKRERLAARKALGTPGTIEIPVWMIHNGWQGVDVRFPDEQRESGR